MGLSSSGKKLGRRRHDDLRLATGMLAVAMVLAWVWDLDPGPAYPPQDIGAGIKLPVYVTGPTSHSW
jgi:hypothetical protein